MVDVDEATYQLAVAAERLCNATTLSRPRPTNTSGLYCDALWDGWGCWNYTQAGTLAATDCPGFVDGFDVNRHASRYCTEYGEWWRSPKNKTWANYTTCVDHTSIQEGKQVIQMFIAGYSISSVFLAVALFIFFYFKQLRCARVTLHKNLFTSYILTSIFFIPYYTCAAQNVHVLEKNPVWCVTIHVITQYLVTCNFSWMFCEGLYLHTIIVVAFTRGKKLLIACYLIGWGFPVIPTIIYTIVRALDEDQSTRCWIDPSNLTWIIFGPIVGTLIINSIFIINIIRVLVTKIRAVKSPSSQQHSTKRKSSLSRRMSTVEPKLRQELEDFWKAVRAALILIPLLGLQFVLFTLEPTPGTTWHHVFQLTSAFVVSFQGFFVSMIFCFFNGEVNVILRRRWGQHRLMRSGSIVSKHRDSVFFNQTQGTTVNEREESSSSGCLAHHKHNSITRKLNPFKHRSKSCDSATNGLMGSRGLPRDLTGESLGEGTARHSLPRDITGESLNRVRKVGVGDNEGIDLGDKSDMNTVVCSVGEEEGVGVKVPPKRSNSEGGVTRTVTFGEISKV